MDDFRFVNGAGHRSIAPPDKKKLNNTLKKGGVLLAQKVFDVGEWVVKRWIKELDLTNPRRNNKRPALDFNTLARLLPGRSNEEIAKELNCDAALVKYWVNRYKLKEPLPTGAVSLSDAAKTCGVTRATIGQWLRRGLIPNYIKTRHKTFFSTNVLRRLKAAVKYGVLGRARGTAANMPTDYHDILVKIRAAKIVYNERKALNAPTPVEDPENVL